MRIDRAIAVVLMVVFVAGCGGTSSSSGSAPPSPSVSVQPSESVSPTATPTPAPTDAATGGDRKAEMVEFIKQWVELVNQVTHSGDPEPILETMDGCAPCEVLALGIRDRYEAGGWIKGGDWTVLEPVRRIGKPGPRTVFRFRISLAPTRHKAAADAPVVVGGKEFAWLQVTVGPLRGDLKILDLTRLAR